MDPVPEAYARCALASRDMAPTVWSRPRVRRLEGIGQCIEIHKLGLTIDKPLSFNRDTKYSEEAICRMRTTEFV